MYCAKCGAPLKEGTRYCGACGAPVTTTTPPKEQPEQDDTSTKDRKTPEEKETVKPTDNPEEPVSPVDQNPWNATASSSDQDGKKGLTRKIAIGALAVLLAAVLIALRVTVVPELFGSASQEAEEQTEAADEAEAESTGDDTAKLGGASRSGTSSDTTVASDVVVGSAFTDEQITAFIEAYSVAVFDETYTLPDSEDDDEDEAYCRSVVEDLLAGLSTSATARQCLADEFSDTIEDYTDFSVDELGLDADAFVDWYLEHFWYRTDSVYCFEDDGDGSVFFWTLYADFYAFDDFLASVADYLYENDISEGDTLSDEDKAAVQALYEQFLAAFDFSDCNFASVDFTYENGTWVIDEDSWEMEMAWFFWLY